MFDRDDLMFMGCLIILVLVVLSALIGGISIIDSWQCSQLHDVTGLRTEWRFPAGCFVENNGSLIPYERWKVLDVNVRARQ